MLSPLKFNGAELQLLDQRLLPTREEWITCRNLEIVARSIENMTIRGAPAIGCAAAFALALDALAQDKHTTWQSYRDSFLNGCDRLAKTRPTAVNLFFAIDLMKKECGAFAPQASLGEISNKLSGLAVAFYEKDLATCRAIGKRGADLVPSKKKLRLVTHCNAGALATAGYGTALGVIRYLHEKGRLEHVYVDETRPVLQGARLTAFELMHDGIPCSLVIDSCTAYLMQQGRIDMAVVGADRIASNGDTANKIGTYSLAVNAHHHNVPFYVAAPLTTFDSKAKSGRDIVIEERDPDEIVKIRDTRIAPEGVKTYNPSFDVTPAALITGWIAETGVLKPPF